MFNWRNIYDKYMGLSEIYWFEPREGVIIYHELEVITPLGKFQ